MPSEKSTTESKKTYTFEGMETSFVERHETEISRAGSNETIIGESDIYLYVGMTIMMRHLLSEYDSIHLKVPKTCVSKECADTFIYMSVQKRLASHSNTTSLGNVCNLSSRVTDGTYGDLRTERL